MARGRLLPGKAARNEQRKLVATAFNNVAVAFVLAGVLQPALGFLQQGRAFDLAAERATAIFMTVAVVGFMAARAVAGRVED